MDHLKLYQVAKTFCSSGNTSFKIQRGYIDVYGLDPHAALQLIAFQTLLHVTVMQQVIKGIFG